MGSIRPNKSRSSKPELRRYAQGRPIYGGGYGVVSPPGHGDEENGSPPRLARWIIHQKQGGSGRRR